MPKQPAIPGLRDAMKKKVTRREQFLADMESRNLTRGGALSRESNGWALVQ